MKKKKDTINPLKITTNLDLVQILVWISSSPQSNWCTWCLTKQVFSCSYIAYTLYCTPLANHSETNRLHAQHTQREFCLFRAFHIFFFLVLLAALILSLWFVNAWAFALVIPIRFFCIRSFFFSSTSFDSCVCSVSFLYSVLFQFFYVGFFFPFLMLSSLSFCSQCLIYIAHRGSILKFNAHLMLSKTVHSFFSRFFFACITYAICIH